MIEYNSGLPDDLSAIQFQVLRFIIEFRDRNGRSPSGGEIAAHFNWKSTTSAYKHVNALIRKQYLVSSMPSQRLNTWRLSLKGRRFDPKAIPLLGQILAGPLEDAVEAEATMIYGLKDLLPEVKTTDVFCNVTTDVLVEKGIPKGSLVVARPGMKHQDGDLVVLKCQARLMLRTVHFPSENMVRLEAANENYEPIEVSTKEVSILGPVIATISTRIFAR